MRMSGGVRPGAEECRVDRVERESEMSEAVAVAVVVVGKEAW